MHISKDILHIAVAESSVIIRNGISATLEKLTSVKVHIVEVSSMEALYECMEAHSPDILVVNPMFCGSFSLDQMKRAYPTVKYVALAFSGEDNGNLAGYDATLSIFETFGPIEKIFEDLSENGNDSDASSVGKYAAGTQGVPAEPMRGEMYPDMLSQREREIVVFVVKGLTNKEIADKLFLSVHTVITHRKNISRKLQIHSAAGLTIYAIANKLVELKDCKQTLK